MLPAFLSSIDMTKKVLVIGGGIAGMTAASSLAESGLHVDLIEKKDHLGGHVHRWDRLFPSFRPGDEVTGFLENKIDRRISLHTNANIQGIVHLHDEFVVLLENDEEISGNAIILATGYELFDAAKKEEYGYGIYDNVITSAELEDRFKAKGRFTNSKDKVPDRIAFIHCVGSRDEKVGNLYCSKVCCVTGVKQAIEIKELLPSSEVFCFYMDLRMFDRNFEELYFEAQQKWGINFIRGRLSECAENPDHSIVLKTEDTLTGRPLKMTVDLMVLLVGFVPSPETMKISTMLGLQKGVDGFLKPEDEHLRDNDTVVPGVFIAGAVKGPSCIVNTIADARSTALQVVAYLKSKE